MKNRIILPFILLAGLALASCSSSGGGGSGGDPTEAVIDSNNEQALATAATEAAKQAIDNTDAPIFGARSAAKSDNFAFLIQDIPCDSGSASININDSTGNGVVTYNNCNFGGGAVVNGTVTISTTQSGDTITSRLEYNNFTITFASETQSFDLSVVCVTNTSTFDVSCTYDSEALGIDGRTYSVSGATVSGDSTSGYTVSASVTDPDHGTLSITTNSPITFNCTNGQPDSGEIQFTDGDGNSVTVTFDTCTSYTVAYSGSSTSYTWETL